MGVIAIDGTKVCANACLAEELAVERDANAQYEGHRKRGVMKNGRRFGRPPSRASRSELAAAEVTEAPRVVVADAGYWHLEQLNNITGQGMPVLIPPDSVRTSAGCKPRTRTPGAGT